MTVRYLADGSGKTRYVSQASLNADSAIIFFNGQYTYTPVINDITELDVVAELQDGIGKDTEIWLWGNS